MSRIYLRRSLEFILLNLVLFLFCLIQGIHSFSAVCFGSLILNLNILLSAFLFYRTSNHRTFKNSLSHRLALLLAISIKGINLLFLTYLGIVFLRFGGYSILLGAFGALVVHVLILFALLRRGVTL